MTQHDLILRYLNNFRTITPYEAFKELGITKLATRISELKKMGYVFGDRWIEDINRFGENVRYKMYFLVKRRKDWDEEDLLNLTMEQFTARFDVAEEEYEMLHKDMQEM